MMQYVVFSDVPYKLSPQVAAINNCKLATLAEVEVIIGKWFLKNLYSVAWQTL